MTAPVAAELVEALDTFNGVLRRAAGQDFLAAAAELDLPLTHMKTLYVLDCSGTLSVSELATRLHLSCAAASRVVETLHRRGLVDRYENPADRRIKQASLTDTGVAAFRSLANAQKAGMLRFAQSLPDDVARTLTEALEAVIATQPSTESCS